MRYPEEELVDILNNAGVDFTASLPCEKIKKLLELTERSFFHVPLTREEEGVGICAGAALSGRRPAVFVQSSGIGNMINALLSLTGFYGFPLALFVSRRGIYQEKIEAQFPMGQRLPLILKAAGIAYSVISSRDDFRLVGKKLAGVYKHNKLHAFLLSPAIWEKSDCVSKDDGRQGCEYSVRRLNMTGERASRLKAGKHKPKYTRFEILKSISPWLDSKVVVCNLGFPSKELFHIKHQQSNFYMLGSMGMATPIGLGVSLISEKEVVVIDGDGSLLMNPGTLATAAYLGPKNLTIIAIDNAAYGSTGNQPTLTASCVDLQLMARGFGIMDSIKVSDGKQLIACLKKPGSGMRFIHVLAVPGNKDVPDIKLHHLEIKKQVQDFLLMR